MTLLLILRQPLEMGRLEKYDMIACYNEIQFA